MQTITDSAEAFEGFRGLIPLYGNSYEPHRKALFYNLMGHCVRHNILKDGIIYLDTRIPLAVALPPEHGKGSFIYTVKTVLKKTGDSVGSPVSFHPESLIGRVEKERADKETREVTGEDWMYWPAPGELSRDYVILNDALQFLTDPKHEDGRSYLLGALDPLGRNTMTKPQSGVPEAHTLTLQPHCSTLMLFQPKTFAESLVKTGFMRRWFLVASPVDEEERRRALKQKEPAKSDTAIDPDAWGEFYLDVRNYGFDWHLPQSTLDIASDEAIRIIDGAAKAGLVSREYANTCLFTTRNWFVRGGMVNAACSMDENIMPEYVVRAVADLEDAIRSSLGYIAKNIPDFSPIPKDGWYGLHFARRGYDRREWADEVELQLDRLRERDPRRQRQPRIEVEEIDKWWTAFKYCGALQTDNEGRVASTRWVY